MKSSSVSGNKIKSSEALKDVRYEIRGQLANHALELEKRGYEVVSLNIGNPGLFGFRTPETMRLAMIENLGQAEPYCHQQGIFPAHISINGRNYWRLSEVTAWLDVKSHEVVIS